MNQIIVIMTSLVSTYSFGQTSVSKIYYGDNRLEKQYGYSGQPPYNMDTTIIEGYHLPLEFKTSSSVEFVVLQKTKGDSIATEIAMYQNGKMSGLYVSFYNDGKLNQVMQRPAGPAFHFVGIRFHDFTHLPGNSPYFSLNVNEVNNQIWIDIEISKIKYHYIVSANGKFLKQFIKGDDNSEKYYTLWPN